MQVLQRSFSVLLGIFFLTFAVTLVVQEKGDYGYNQWGKIQVNRFLECMSTKGKVSYQEYQLLYGALNQFGVNVEFIIKEYQREEDVKGTVYWYLISWEEIKEFLYSKDFHDEALLSSYQFEYKNEFNYESRESHDRGTIKLEGRVNSKNAYYNVRANEKITSYSASGKEKTKNKASGELTIINNEMFYVNLNNKEK